MKKSIAAVSATILGFAGVAVASAAPAQAAAPDCTTVADHEVSTVTSGSVADADWYMDCIPQYGLGKVNMDFEFDGETPDPAFSLTDLDDVTITSNVAEDATAYSSTSSRAGGFTQFSSNGPGVNSINASGYALYPIDSVEKVTAASLSPDCLTDGATYDAVYKITYKPSTTTFQTTAAANITASNGTAGKWVVDTTAAPMVLALNFAAGGGGFDTNKPLCSVSDGVTVKAASQAADSSAWNVVSGSQATGSFYFLDASTLNPIPNYGSSTYLGSFPLLGAFPVAAEITTTTLPNGTVGEGYSQTVEATGDADIVFSVSDGALPAGLTLDADTGEISGTPTYHDDYAFTIEASNAVGSDEQAYAISVRNAAGAPDITVGTDFDGGVVGEEYSELVTTTGTAPIAFSVISGELPDGLALDADTGEISGTPTERGRSTFRVEATNASGNDSKRIRILISEAPSITSGASLADGTEGEEYSDTVAAVGDGTIEFSIAGGALPEGLELDAETGDITGTPEESGDFDFTIAAASEFGTDEQDASISIAAAVVVVADTEVTAGNLAATNVNAAPGLIAGAVFLLAGLAFTAFGPLRRRLRAGSPVE